MGLLGWTTSTSMIKTCALRWKTGTMNLLRKEVFPKSKDISIMRQNKAVLAAMAEVMAICVFAAKEIKLQY